MPETPPPLAPDDTNAADPLAPGGRLDVNRLIAEHGDAKQAAHALALKVDKVEGDNARYRARIAAYEAAAPEGSAILPAAEVAQWEAYKAHGTPEDLAARLAQAEKDAEAVAEHARQAALAPLAAHVDLAVWGSLKGTEGLALSLEGEGEEAVPTVTPEGGEPVPLADYAAEHFAPVASALLRAESPPVVPLAPAVRPFVAQPTGGRTGALRPAEADKIAETKRAEPIYNGV